MHQQPLRRTDTHCREMIMMKSRTLPQAPSRCTFTRLTLLARRWVPLAFVAAAPLSACIAPPPKSAEDKEAEANSEPLTVAEKVRKRLEDTGIVAVVPDDALIWDGANISLINIDPGGSWYAFADTTPSGQM